MPDEIIGMLSPHVMRMPGAGFHPGYVPHNLSRLSSIDPMTWNLLLAQSLNGLQYGLLLFLLAAGLTLVLGIMNFVNLAHGSLYMLGAYLGAAVFAKTGSFLIAGAAAVLGTMLIGLIVERTTLFAFYARDHLDQVLATFGLILFFNEAVRVVWGPAVAVHARARRI